MVAPDTSDPDPGVVPGHGRVLAGRYRVERVLGRGGMGEVLLAHDTLLHRPVALKHVRPDGPLAADRRSAILKEARRASQVNDRRIAAIHDVLDLGDDVLIVMEYVEGETLRRHLGAPFTLETFWPLAGECLEALRAAHAHGVVHRDIKPENLMLTREQGIKILDFGIALRSDRHPGELSPDDSTSSIDQSRRPAGTPRYMAPEAHYGGHIDERTDIFALGAVFYEMLTGRHPFEGGGYATMLDHIMNTPAEPVSRVNPAASEALSGVIGRMLARDPAQRFGSCEEVAAALDAAREGAPAAAGAARAAGAGAILPSPARATAPVEPPRGGPAPVPPRPARRVRLAFVAVAAVSAVAWPMLGGPTLPREKNLALLLPTAQGNDPELVAFALGSVELLTSRLQRHQDDPHFQLQPFSESRVEHLSSAPDARKLLGANLALVSTFGQQGNSLAARLELRESASGRLLRQRRIVAQETHLLDFVDSLYRSSLQLLALPPRRQDEASALGVRGTGTLRLLAQGIGRMHSAQPDDDLARAREDLENACRAEPEAALPRVWRAAAEIKSYQRTKDPNWLVRAEASARSAAGLDRRLADAHRVLGEALYLLKRPAEAVAEFRLACALDPTRDDAWMGYGRSLRLLGDHAGERAVYVEAIERRPHAFRPRWWLANHDYQHGRVGAAASAFREMVRRAPDFSRGYTNLGGMLVQLGAYDQAIDTLRHSLALRPSASAYANLGTAYFNTGRWQECLEAYNQQFQFDVAKYALWLNLGDAYFWLLKNPSQARDAYQQTVRMGHEAMLETAESGDAPDPMIPANLATVFPKLGHPDSARIYLRQATDLDSLNMGVQYRAALTHWQLGERARALDWLERAVWGGYPRAWLRDSPVHAEWRSEPRFIALLQDAGMAAVTNPSPETGGRR